MRIVSFLPAATEMACALGLGDQLAGVSHECDYPPHLHDRPVVVRGSLVLDGLSASAIDEAVRAQLHRGASLYTVDEQLLALIAPDLILTQDLCQVCAPSGNEVTRAIAALAQTPGILWFTPRTLADVEENLRELGGATGREDRAESLIAAGRARLSAVREQVSGAARPRVFVVEWVDPIYACGHWVPEMIDIAGGTDALGHPGADSVRVAWGDVAAWSPEVVIVAPCGYGLAAATEQAQSLVRRPEWRLVPAVLGGRVFAVDANSYVARPGPRLIDGVELFAHLIHPERVSWTGPSGAFAVIEADGTISTTSGSSSGVFAA